MSMVSTSRRCRLLAGLIALTVAATAQGQNHFRGIWVDMFHAGFKSTAEIDALVSRAVAGRYNAIIAEVLGFHDNRTDGHGAYWNSSIVPKARDIVGGIDPLAYLCQRAHAQNPPIEVHAWLVAYRCSSVWPPQGNPTVQAHPEWIMVSAADQNTGPKKLADAHYVFDPGNPEVQEYLVSIVRELVTNYPIDGINWDYIRYTQTDAGYPAWNNPLSSYARWQAAGGSWDDFRRRTIDELVRRVRWEIPLITTNPRQPVRQSADVISNGSPPGDCNFGGTSAYGLFQNYALWMQRGYVDAIMPMIYKRDHCPNQYNDFRNWCDRILNCWRYQRHVFCGPATYLNDFDSSLAQMQYALIAANGVATYSYAGSRVTETICEDPPQDPWTTDHSWFNYIATNLFTSNATVPSMPWRNPATATEGTIYGRIMDENGNWLDNATVNIHTQSAECTGFPFQSVTTDGNGYYTLGAIPAAANGTAYKLCVKQAGIVRMVNPSAYSFRGQVVPYDFKIGFAPPIISVSPQTLNRSVLCGRTLPGDTLNVINAGLGSSTPLNYSISESTSWITSVSPFFGTSWTENDAITVTYDTSGLSVGTYVGTIQVTDGAAVKSSETVTINLTVKQPGDYDDDLDCDQSDFAKFQACMGGPPLPTVPAGCALFDFNGDKRVNEADFSKFLNCFSGPGGTPPPTCAD